MAQYGYTTNPSLEYVEKGPVFHVLKMFRKFEHPHRPSCLVISETEPVLLSVAGSLFDGVRGVNVPSEGECTLPMRVNPLTVFDTEFRVIYTCTSNCENRVWDLLKSGE